MFFFVSFRRVAWHKRLNLQALACTLFGKHAAKLLLVASRCSEQELQSQRLGGQKSPLQQGTLVS